MENTGKLGTANTYKAALNIFEKFASNKCAFDDINVTKIIAFETYLKNIPVKQNTITFYMRILRAIYNKAKIEGFISKNIDPFKTISFRIDKTRKLAISSETLRTINQADFGKQNYLTESRDLFMFSFYARGMSFVDIANLKQEDIDHGTIFYTRQKTGQIFSIRITPSLQAIIDRYTHCSPWIMPVMNNSVLKWNNIPEIVHINENSPLNVQHKRYKLALSRYLYYLTVISKNLNTEKKLTFNVARHSWASLARNKGIPVAVISDGLGHTSEKTTSIYLDQVDSHQVDNANEIVSQL